MEHTISIGQLRQNPTEMIRDVRQGAVYVLTDRGQPVADIRPHQSSRWRRGHDVGDLFGQLGPDQDWAAEARRLRTQDALRDPWADGQ